MSNLKQVCDCHPDELAMETEAMKSVLSANRQAGLCTATAMVGMLAALDDILEQYRALDPQRFGDVTLEKFLAMSRAGSPFPQVKSIDRGKAQAIIIGERAKSPAPVDEDPPMPDTKWGRPQ